MKYLEIAKRIALENPDTNLSVGCVIVKDDKIISFGFRRTFIYSQSPYLDRTIHAEQMAISTCNYDLNGAELYCTLEPCTCRPAGSGWDEECPCCELIVKSGIKKVIFANYDNHIGKGGSNYLKKHNVESIYHGD